MEPCSCIESDLLWALFSGEAPPPDTAGMRALLALAEAIAVRHLREVRPMLADSPMFDCIPDRYDLRHRITSVLDCGVCGRATEVVHPISREHFAALPSTDWVRCERCSSRREELQGVA